MRASQHAVYRKEIRRLHYKADTLIAANRVLVDAMAHVRADCAAEVADVKAAMAPGFSWPDPDGVAPLYAKIDALEAELVRVTTELATANAKLGKVTKKYDELRRRYAHHNTAGKNKYTERRSKVNDEIKKIEAEIAAEMGADLDAERKRGGERGGAGRSEGRAEGHAGSSHSNRPDAKAWHVRTECPNCHTRGRLVRDKYKSKLVSDFFGDHMWLETVCHTTFGYECGACCSKMKPPTPGISGTSFGKKALGFIVQLGGKKCVDADIAEIFTDMFEFPVGETTIWNARCAAADLLAPTRKRILDKLSKEKFLGIDETHYPINGEKGYVWVVRSDNATLVLPMATRGEIVITEHLSGLLHIPVTTDGFAPYLKYFKILQRCWAHILRDAEAAYVLLEKDDPDRLYYRYMYRKLLRVFRDAKAVAAKTADAGGADLHTCAKFEQRVMRIVSAYGTHKFATTLEGAAPNLFTFLRYPGMPPTNNPTERDIRDTSVVQRKIRHQFMNSRGMRVFSMIQSFNSTCRKQGLVPWKCMAKIVDDPTYDIFQAGDDVRRISPPWRDTKPATHRLYVDGVAVDTRATDLDGDGAEALAAEALAAKGGLEADGQPPPATVAEGPAAEALAADSGLEADGQPPPATVAEGPAAEALAADSGLEADGQPPPATGTVDVGMSPPAQSRAQDTTAYEHTVAPDVYDSLPHHGKPPPAGMV